MNLNRFSSIADVFQKKTLEHDYTYLLFNINLKV